MPLGWGRFVASLSTLVMPAVASSAVTSTPTPFVFRKAHSLGSSSLRVARAVPNASLVNNKGGARGDHVSN